MLIFYVCKFKHYYECLCSSTLILVMGVYDKLHNLDQKFLNCSAWGNY